MINLIVPFHETRIKVVFFEEPMFQSNLLEEQKEYLEKKKKQESQHWIKFDGVRKDWPLKFEEYFV